MNTEIKDPSFLYTASGLKYAFADPDPMTINIEDIAHQLALTNRWGGCSRQPFSVAQHSCLVAELVHDHEMKKVALLHDATEAYVGDMPRPLKKLNPEYRGFEAKAWKAIVKRFKLAVDPEAPMPKPVKEADVLLLAWEAELLMPANCHKEQFIHLPSYPEGMIGLLEPWAWRTARSTFLAYYKRLFG